MQDLCARLQYEVECLTFDGQVAITGKLCSFNKLTDGSVLFGLKDKTYNAPNKYYTPKAIFNYETIKPYLRPLSSMTTEEIDEYVRLRHKDCIDVERPAHCCKNSITAVVVTLTSREYVRYWYNDMVSTDTIYFLNSRHLDWRGLIPMELALEAPEGMYKTKNE